MSIYTATAPGKLMLMGEHAVVYGYPCLVTAVDLRYQAVVTRRDDIQVEIRTSQLATPRRVPLAEAGLGPPKETAFVEAVAARFRDAHGLETGFGLSTAGPKTSYGLGSSSAVTVATAAALNAMCGAGLDKRALFDLCYGAVLDVQGRGSGYDVASAVYGGTLYYKDGQAHQIHIPEGGLPLVIGYSGRKVGTVGLVAGVADLRERFPAVVDAVFENMARITQAGRDTLAAKDAEQFGTLMNMHQGLTDALGVNTGVLSRLVYAARAAGALGAKLSGAGGGDCMYAWSHPEQVPMVEKALTAAGGEIIRLRPGAPGVQLK